MKNTIAFEVNFPAKTELEAALRNRKLPELKAQEITAQGFIPHPRGDGEAFVLDFPGGLSFALQLDEKVIPASLLNKKLQEKCLELSGNYGRWLSRKEKSIAKEELLDELAARALHKSKVVEAFYHTESKTLLVDTSSDTIANVVIHNLIHTLGTMKTTTIHVSGLKDGLQRRLVQVLTGEDKQAFGELRVAGHIRLEGLKQRKASFTLGEGTLHEREQEILAMLSESWRVLELELEQDSLSLVFTHDFTIKKITVADAALEGELEDPLEMWQHTTGVQVALIASTLESLKKLFGFGEEEQAEAA